MRDILVTLLVFGSLPFILRRPYVGVLVWAWLSYMNPHRLAYGFSFNMPFAQIVALTLLISLLISSEKKQFPINSTTVLWFIYIAWMGVTTIFAIYPDEALDMYNQVLKIQFIIFLSIMLMTDIDRLNKLIWVIVLSIGYFSIKGGVFTLLTGGGFRVWGPPGSAIEENNALGLATLMILPLIVYLYQTSKNKWLRYFLLFAFFSSAVSVLGSQSRGALVASITVGLFFWLKSDKKVWTGVLVIVLGTLAYNFMPDSWHERMGTMKTYEEDASAMGRINAWYYNFHLANDKFTGGGYRNASPETFQIYAPDPTIYHTAHSIYFGVLGDHGWIGLILFVLIIVRTWRNFSSAIRETKDRDRDKDLNLMARMMQVSLIAYLSGGAFLSLAYYDLSWHIVAISLIISEFVKQRSAQGKLQAQQATAKDTSAKRLDQRFARRGEQRV